MKYKINSEFVAPPPAALESVDCNICHRPEYIKKFTRFGYTIVECPACSLRWVNPRLVQEAAKDVYAARYFEIRNSKENTDDPVIESFKIENAIRHLQNIERIVPVGKLLDIGCGEGLLLSAAERRGWDVCGVEFSPQAAAMAKEVFRDRIIQGTLQSAAFPDEQFDVVTMIDVIEHVYDPASELLEIKRILRPGGIVYLLTPDCGSFFSKIMGKYWFEIKPREHIYYFSGKTLEMLLNKAGFKLLGMNSSGKILTFKYIARILEKENPLLGRGLRIFTEWTPIYNRPLSFNVGFIVGIAEKEKA